MFLTHITIEVTSIRMMPPNSIHDNIKIGLKPIFIITTTLMAINKITSIIKITESVIKVALGLVSIDLLCTFNGPMNLIA